MVTGAEVSVCMHVIGYLVKKCSADKTFKESLQLQEHAMSLIADLESLMPPKEWLNLKSSGELLQRRPDELQMIRNGTTACKFSFPGRKRYILIVKSRDCLKEAKNFDTLVLGNSNKYRIFNVLNDKTRVDSSGTNDDEPATVTQVTNYTGPVTQYTGPVYVQNGPVYNYYNAHGPSNPVVDPNTPAYPGNARVDSQVQAREDLANADVPTISSIEGTTPTTHAVVEVLDQFSARREAEAFASDSSSIAGTFITARTHLLPDDGVDSGSDVESAAVVDVYVGVYED